eukprot:CAMPEP_0170610458 /NCGR_PEP_ID=MMETSP0224-20130122/22671_1 /TAXON_ID=285029 /ORGANISM="Togula jolla, Strain CCCM 725" /LENGTH=557 /DNA_ID=CAMNT_0010935837 /DNA_START=1 /DNA_END=1670 /DNA_ORIENTATION=+
MAETGAAEPLSRLTPVERLAPVVRTSFGALEGIDTGRCCIFLGVPYAEPPKRFARPEQLRPWEGTLRCCRAGPQAVQSVFNIASARQLADWFLRLTGRRQTPPTLPKDVSEDCLRLNIVSPSLTGCAPVICWIHGGAFIMGSGADGLYRGSKLTRSEGVVLVSINYRLGCLGFLNLPGADANCGLYDQLEALRWIQSEIRHFGGDPDNVTICGESAGGMACGSLLTAPLARNLFRRAILMSGACSNVMDADDAAVVGREFCLFATGNANAGVDALRKLSAAELLAAQWKLLTSKKSPLAFQPCVDGELVPARPLDILAAGCEELRGKEVILGSNLHEWHLFSLMPDAWHLRRSLRDAASDAAINLGPSRMAIEADGERSALEAELREIMKNIRREGNLKNWAEVEKVFYTTVVFTGPVRLAAELLSRSGAAVYVYSFEFSKGDLGATHGAELPLLFGTHANHWFLRRLSGAGAAPEEADLLSQEFMARFGAFARTGTPTPARRLEDGGGVQQWPQYLSGQVPSFFVFDRHCRVAEESPESALRDVLRLLRRTRRPYG